MPSAPKELFTSKAYSEFGSSSKDFTIATIISSVTEQQDASCNYSSEGAYILSVYPVTTKSFSLDPMFQKLRPSIVGDSYGGK